MCTFAKLYNLYRHVELYHVTSEESSMYASLGKRSGDDVIDNREVDQVACCETVTNDDCRPLPPYATLQNVIDEGVALIAGLRGNSSIPYNVLPDIVGSYNQICGIKTSDFEAQLRESLVAANVDNGVVANIMQSMQSKFASCQNPFAFMSSNYKINKYFSNHPLYVAPEQVILGARHESHSGQSKLVYDSFQYVGIEKTFASLDARSKIC
jgi:hypothetical protein